MSVVRFDQAGTAKPADCPIKIYPRGINPDRPVKLIGQTRVDDTGFSVNCGEERVYEILRERACAAGADAVAILEERTPGFSSTCFRVKAAFLLFDGTSSAAVVAEEDAPPASQEGTCFAVSPGGTVVTNHHVVNKAKRIEVTLTSGQTVPATVKATSEGVDIAVLKVAVATPTFLSFAPPRSVRAGDQVFTVGFPVSDFLGDEPKFSEGVINSLAGPSGAAHLLQISVPIQPGNSGGPLVNASAEVVGVVTATAAVLPFIRATGTMPQNVNFAVKADFVTPLLDDAGATAAPRDRSEAINRVSAAVCRVRAFP